MPTDLIRELVGMTHWWNVNSLTTFAVDTAGKKIASGPWRAEKAGTVDRIAFNGAAKAGAMIGDFRLETRSVNLPSGSLYGGSAALTQNFTGVSTGGNEVTLATPATVAAGDDFFVVLDCTSGSVGVDTYTFNNSLAMLAAAQRPYALTHNGASYSGVAAHSCLVPRYSDASGGDYLRGGFAFASLTLTNSFNSTTVAGSGGDERGMKWTPEADADLSEFLALAHPVSSTGDLNFCVYANDSASATPDGMVALLAASTRSGGLSMFNEKWPAVIAEVSGSPTRVTLKAGANNVRIPEVTFLNTKQREALVGGHVYTFRTDLGAWTDNDLKAVPIAGVRSAITIPAGGGSTIVPIRNRNI